MIQHPIIRNLEKAAEILATVSEQFVFTGGSTIILYAREDSYTEIRSTEDVDCVVNVNNRRNYYILSYKLRLAGLTECDRPSSPLCRWRYQGLAIDIMPCDVNILGFSNQWYIDGIANAIAHTLPSQREIYIFSPIYLLATKIEAYLSRGKSFRFSKDVEDIIVLLDGSASLEQDYNRAPFNLKSYINSWFTQNEQKLIEAVYFCCPSKDTEREDYLIDLIEKLAIASL